MRQKLLIGFFGSAFALGACGGGGGGFATKEDLAKAVVDTLAKKDKAAFLKLYASVDTALSHCSAMEGMRSKFEADRVKNDVKNGEGFDECAKADWTKAKIVETKGGDLKDAEEQCPDVREMRDIDVLAEIDGKKYVVKIDDPVQFGGKVYLWDRFECETEEAKVDEPAPAVADAAPEKVEPTEPAAAADPAAPAEPAAAAVAEPAAAAGTSECDKFVAAYEACLGKLPEAARSGAESGLKQMKEMFAKVPDKAMLETTCKQSYDSVKQAMGSFCPDAFK